MHIPILTSHRQRHLANFLALLFFIWVRRVREKWQEDIYCMTILFPGCVWQFNKSGFFFFLGEQTGSRGPGVMADLITQVSFVSVSFIRHPERNITQLIFWNKTKRWGSHIVPKIAIKWLYSCHNNHACKTRHAHSDNTTPLSKTRLH